MTPEQIDAVEAIRDDIAERLRHHRTESAHTHSLNGSELGYRDQHCQGYDAALTEVLGMLAARIEGLS